MSVVAVARTPYYDECVTLVSNMRPQDRAEMQAARGGITGADVYRATRQTESYVAYVDDRLACIYGLAPHQTPHVGVPWLLGTDVLDAHLVSLCKRARRIVAEWNDLYPTLTNLTDARNTKIIAWLRWLGFSFTSNVVTLRGHTFLQFVRTQGVRSRHHNHARALGGLVVRASGRDAPTVEPTS